MRKLKKICMFVMVIFFAFTILTGCVNKSSNNKNSISSSENHKSNIDKKRHKSNSETKKSESSDANSSSISSDSQSSSFSNSATNQATEIVTIDNYMQYLDKYFKTVAGWNDIKFIQLTHTDQGDGSFRVAFEHENSLNLGHVHVDKDGIVVVEDFEGEPIPPATKITLNN